MKLSDMIYQEAIENNYSHEQMTPLNLLKANISLIKLIIFEQFKNYQDRIQDILDLLNKKITL